MDLFRIIDNCKSKDRPSFIYISLDTIEGSSSVGHWIWECSLFLPYIKDLVKTPFKILLKEKKNYKLNILSDFGFYDDDIVYSNKMASDGQTNQEQYVIPSEEEYIMYVPKFFYLWNTVLENNVFLDAFNRFRDYYALPDIVKTTPISYIARSRKENYLTNYRHFVNVDEFIEMINMKNVNIIDVDNFSSLKPQ